MLVVIGLGRLRTLHGGTCSRSWHSRAILRATNQAREASSTPTLPSATDISAAPTSGLWHTQWDEVRQDEERGATLQHEFVAVMCAVFKRHRNIIQVVALSDKVCYVEGMV